MARSFAILPSGLTLQYFEQGNETGHPVILLHGYTDSWFSFSPVFPHLPHGFRAFALSQRGHGDSDRPQSGFSPKHFARDVAEFLDVMRVDRAVVVGHSMGSFMAQRFAIDYPSRISGLVLIGSFRTVGSNQVINQLWADVSQLSDPVDRKFVVEFQQGTIAQPVAPEFFELVVNESLKVPARIWKSALKEGHIDVDHSPELTKIQVPTLLLYGDRDSITSLDEQHALSQAIPNAKLIVYQGIGHALHWEAPQRFASDLSRFIAELKPESTTSAT